MRWISDIKRGGRSRLFSLFALGTALLTTGATMPRATSTPVKPLNLAGLTIYFPVEIPSHPVIIVPRRPVEPTVTVRFIAEGNDWATVYLDGDLLFQAFNTRRDYTVDLPPGAYFLEITGVTRFDLWASGYLDVGRDNSNVILLRYGKEDGVRVAGDTNIWLPDDF